MIGTVPLDQRESTSATVHATTIAIDGTGVMLVGESGAGKSDLALRLIDRGASLVSDDYTTLSVVDGMLRATPPAAIAGRIEVRGVGIATLPFVMSMPLALVVVLGDEADRLPHPQSRLFLGHAVRAVAIDPRRPSAALKVEIALRQQLPMEEA